MPGTLHLGWCSGRPGEAQRGKDFPELLSREPSWGLRQGHEGKGCPGSKGAQSLQGSQAVAGLSEASEAAMRTWVWNSGQAALRRGASVGQAGWPVPITPSPTWG